MFKHKKCEWEHHQILIKDRHQKSRLLIDGYIHEKARIYCLNIPNAFNDIFFNYYGCYECNVRKWELELDLTDFFEGKYERFYVKQAMELTNYNQEYALEWLLSEEFKKPREVFNIGKKVFSK